MRTKLVRDKIPEIIAAGGGVARTHVASDEEHWERLKEKLAEEVREFCEDSNKEELADLLEVVDAIKEFKGFDDSEIKEIKEKKLLERGGFSGRIVLEGDE